MALFTCIMEYEGGTYISQVEAVSVKAACLSWARNLDVSQIAGLGAKGKLLLIEEMRGDSNRIVSIEGVSNVWFVGALIRRKPVSVNVVQTAEPESPVS
jgi:hypothetical protein